jgi:glucose-6-phosphate isomerase
MRPRDPEAEVKLAAALAAGQSISDLFAQEPNRAQDMTWSAEGLRLDLSKQRISARQLQALLTFARDRRLEESRDALFAGAVANPTEGRAALHSALRGFGGHESIRAEVAATREKARAFKAAFDQDPKLGGAEPIEAIVHLGTGGSDLGPRLVLDALKAYRQPGLTVRFAANIDPEDLADALEGLNPRRTLLIIASKTFTTLETMANAQVARAWLLDGLGASEAGARLVAVTAKPAAAIAWGVAESNVFPFWDWVGGRYSLWSSVSLCAELALETGVFEAVLTGAKAMDQHTAREPLEHNLPAIAALAAHWNRAVLGHRATGTIVYAHRLRLLVDWLQQLEMESNGKSVDMAGRSIPSAAAGVTWGGVGTSAQHSFFQLLHQGVDEIPLDIILLERSDSDRIADHRALNANALAQAQALLQGKSQDKVAAEGAPEALWPHKAFTGDRATSLLGVAALTPASLGALLAFFEHRTVFQAWLAGINPFDQWGVELGKQMATSLIGALQGAHAESLDPSTAAWISRLRQN